MRSNCAIIAGLSTATFVMISLNASGQSISNNDLIGFWQGVAVHGEETINSISIRSVTDTQFQAILNFDDEILNAEVTFTEGVFEFSLEEKQLHFKGFLSINGLELRAYLTRGNRTRPFILQKENQIWKGKPGIINKDFLVLYHFYLGKNQELKARIHNSSVNMDAFLPVDSVQINENKITFEMEPQAAFMLSGKLDDDQLLIESRIGNDVSHYILEKVKENDAITYKPTKTNNPYEYKIPEKSPDWEVAHLQDMDINISPIAKLIESINSEVYRHVHSVLIIKGGKLVLEEYFYGHTANDIHEIRSVFKPFASAITGIAMDKGYLKSVEQPILEFFPEYSHYDNWDPRKKDITIEHLLTMSSGLDNSDWNNAQGGESQMRSQNKQQDWIKFQLDLPLLGSPGEIFAYSSGGMNVLSQIISNVTQSTVLEFMDQHLLQPLDINDFNFFHAPDGQEYLAGDFYLRPRDMAKFGQLYLNNGTWKGNQVISSNWIEKSTKVHVEQRKYGYLWWLPSLSYEERTIPFIYVNGSGGQSIMIIPELDIVIVFTGGNFNLNIFENVELVKEYIIPAVLSRY